MPAMAMVIHTTANMPPITDEGMAAIAAENLPKKPSPTSTSPAATNTMRLATPVMEITPALVEYPVTGVPPTSAATPQLRPSPTAPRSSCWSVMGWSMTADTANQVPVVSAITTR